MKLATLINDLNINESASANGKDFEIVDVTTSPDLCKNGTLYLAAECETVSLDSYGTRLDGREFITQALKNGASAVLTTKDTEPLADIPFLFHDNPLEILGSLARKLFNTPEPDSLALVTGTNGKTSVANFASQFWTLCNVANCSFGNLGGVTSNGDEIWKRDHTLSVPETVELHKMLVDLKKQNIVHIAMEATSHALYDYRLNECGANIGVFTNLTRDHLDFHKTMEAYFEAKMTLFKNVLPQGSHAIINADTSYYGQVLEICKNRNQKIISVGQNGTDIKVIKKKKIESGHLLDLEVFGESFTTEFNLEGDFQISNALCALAIALASGVEVKEAMGHLADLKPVEGRLINIANTNNGGKVIVDFAHTPDGLKESLEACRSFTTGKLTVVFGCNGDRDTGKRKEMGSIASKYADIVYVTDGHPRSEDPQKIRESVVSGAPGAISIEGRKNAIEEALSKMADNDTVLLAGLGHLNYQIIGSKKFPFDERSISVETLKKLGTLKD